MIPDFLTEFSSKLEVEETVFDDVRSFGDALPTPGDMAALLKLGDMLSEDDLAVFDVLRVSDPGLMAPLVVV